MFCWTDDWFEGHASGAAVDPVGAVAGNVEILRGGKAWLGDTTTSQVARRYGSTPAYRFGNIGARVARSAP